MRRIVFIIIFTLGSIIYFLFINKITTYTTTQAIDGTWKMIYAEIKENDSIKIKDLTHTSFIKILNKTHFSFLNQNDFDSKQFYSGAGIYSLNGNKYTETITHTPMENIRGVKYTFLLKFKGDTLIQSGIEEIKGVKRKILEKYVRLDNSMSLKK
ncbi:hypothetical protein [uncultured Lacinutrix sp.]|uniref:hypothetical protein n=1 Tax=uncultured Lacinutrix sp. TaxID=574032 RepID=UPI002622E188|nr:hypothetical protein [uncultured Lacinutrix sp.]